MDRTQEKKIISMYKKRRPIAWIMKETGLSRNRIEEFLKEKEQWTGHKSLMNYYDEFFFDKIDTEEKAYWLGFIYANGYLDNRNGIGIELDVKDKEHLEKFRKSIQAELNVKVYHKNSTYGPQTNCRFSLSSKHMHTILLGYYKSIHKTFEGEFPKIDKKLERHLIRGFFDGDGTISFSQKKDYSKSIATPSIGFIGTKETLEYIESISSLDWHWCKRIKNNTNNFQISCGKVKQVLSFLHYMYDDATIYLDRKYERFQFILENRERFQAKARV